MTMSNDKFSTEEAIEALMEFGLTREEAEIYILLVENQSMTVRELNQKTPSIQRTYLYNFLDKLARNGWVHIDTMVKPQCYNPYDVDLEEKLREKEIKIREMQKKFKEFKENTFPKLKKFLNSIYESSSWKKITTPYKDYFSDFFKGEKIRVDYTTYKSRANPFLNFLLMNFEFHGFHVFHHEKPISNEQVIHFYIFPNNEILKNSEKMIVQLLNFRRNEIIEFFDKLGNTIKRDKIKIENVEIMNHNFKREIVPYTYKGNEYKGILIHPFIFGENILVLIFSNKLEKGEELLKWLLRKLDKNNKK
ncbi:MAG: helix-turn-helix domain-containing protein [Candidatus Helarchaeota archaeon]